MNPIEQSNKIMKGCGKHYKNELGLFALCGYKVPLCPSCKASRQTAIDIFEEELKWLEFNFKQEISIKNNIIWLRIKELNSAMEILK
jgi:hypothetical protein